MCSIDMSEGGSLVGSWLSLYLHRLPPSHPHYSHTFTIYHPHTLTPSPFTTLTPSLFPHLHHLPPSHPHYSHTFTIYHPHPHFLLSHILPQALISSHPHTLTGSQESGTVPEAAVLGRGGSKTSAPPDPPGTLAT